MTRVKKGEAWDHVQFCAIVTEAGLLFPRAMVITALNHDSKTCVTTLKEKRRVRKLEKAKKYDELAKMKRITCNASTRKYEAAIRNFPTGMKVDWCLHFLLCKCCNELVAVSQRIPAYLLRKHGLAVGASDNFSHGIDIARADKQLRTTGRSYLKLDPQEAFKEGTPKAKLGGTVFRCKVRSRTQSLGFSSVVHLE